MDTTKVVQILQNFPQIRGQQESLAQKVLTKYSAEDCWPNDGHYKFFYNSEKDLVVFTADNYLTDSASKLRQELIAKYTRVCENTIQVHQMTKAWMNLQELSPYDASQIFPFVFGKFSDYAFSSRMITIDCCDRIERIFSFSFLEGGKFSDIYARHNAFSFLPEPLIKSSLTLYKLCAKTNREILRMFL